MGGNNLSVASVGFRLSGDIDSNYREMAKWIRSAAKRGAELVLFCETALTGYNKVHVPDVDKIDRKALERRNDDLHNLAARHGVWLAYGSTHFEDGVAKPFNCMYLVGPDGNQVSRYDKIFLTDTDARAYSPGNHLVVTRIRNFTVGLAICFDMRFPELFRRLANVGTNLVLFGGYQVGGPRAAHMRSVAPATLITRAAENGFYFCAANSCEEPAWHESMIIKYNGDLIASARRHTPGMAIATLDVRDSEPFTDFIRATARKASSGEHPLLGRPLGSG